MATTQTTYTGNGSTTNYSFTFEYLKQADVKVTLDTVATTAFTFANATTLAFTTAPASGVAIRIFRDTAIDNLSATFFPGSAIKAEDLNENFTQNLYVTQESDFEVDTANTTANTAKTTADTALTNSTTAISTANSATTTANTAITTSNSATTTANAATTTANTASTNASSAVTTANTASTNATAAVNTANTASTNASAAVTTANSAQADATTAISTANSATATANSATTTANSAVTSANTANTNATAAQTAATNAQASATAAQTSATAAQTSATAAQAQATLAADVRNAFTVTDSNSDGTFDFVVGDIPIKGNAGVKLPFESVTYAEEGAIRYNNSLDKIELYNGAGQWVTAGGGASVSSTPPTLPSAGDVWYDHDNGRAYVYYNDGDSNQWVEMNPSWNGYVADNSVTSAKIVDGTIVNADVNSSAAIALSKLATGALPSAITVASSNIVDGTIVNADVNASAAIAQSKLALDITNSEVNASAAIAGTKISPNFGSQNVITTGSAGIGTSSPGTALEVAASNAVIRISDTDGSGQIAEVQHSNGVTFLSSRNGDNDAPIVFRGLGNGISNEYARIDSSGRVGIGTASPESNAQATIYEDNGNTPLYLKANNTNSFLYFEDSGTASFKVAVGSSGETLKFVTDGSERIRIDSTGNVGIGTSSPSAILDVADASGNQPSFRLSTGHAANHLKISRSSSTGDYTFASEETGSKINFATDPDGTGSVNRLTVDRYGNIGIGTTSPENYGLPHPTLEIAGSTGGVFQSSSIDDSVKAYFYSDTTVDNARIGTVTNHPFLFVTNTQERMRILSSGGLTFNGDTAAANALDDYEEGTWTPTSVHGTLNANDATYVKIGKLVHLFAVVNGFSDRTSSNTIEIRGLPYTGTKAQAVGSMLGRNCDRTAYSVYVNSGNSGIQFYSISSGDFAALQHDHLNSSQATLYFQATYVIN